MSDRSTGPVSINIHEAETYTCHVEAGAFPCEKPERTGTWRLICETDDESGLSDVQTITGEAGKYEDQVVGCLV